SAVHGSACAPANSHLNAALRAPRLRWLYSRGASPVFYAEAGPQFGVFWNTLKDGTPLGPEEYAVGAVGGVGALWRFSKILRGTFFLNTGFDRAVAEGLTLRLTIGAYIDAI